MDIRSVMCIKEDAMNNKETVRCYYENVVSENRLDEVSQYVAAELADEMRKHIQAVRNTYPDYKVSIIRQFEEGEYVISEVVMRGTHSGEFVGITPTNKVIEITGVNIDRVVNGKIKEHTGAANTFESFLKNGLIKAV